jgi:hypothetical protein
VLYQCEHGDSRTILTREIDSDAIAPPARISVFVPDAMINSDAITVCRYAHTCGRVFFISIKDVYSAVVQVEEIARRAMQRPIASLISQF